MAVCHQVCMNILGHKGARARNLYIPLMGHMVD